MIDSLAKETLLDKCDYQPKLLAEISFSEKNPYRSIRWVGDDNKYLADMKSKSFRPNKKSIFKMLSVNKLYLRYMYEDNRETGGIFNQFRVSIIRTTTYGMMKNKWY